MKNCNRRNSHGHQGSKRSELAQHAGSHGSHAFTHTLTPTRLQLRGAKRQLSYYFQVHAGSFRFSVINRTLTWTTGSLKVRTWSLLCVRIHTGVGHTDSEFAQHFWLAKSHIFFLSSWRDSNLRPLDLESDALPIEPPRHSVLIAWKSWMTDNNLQINDDATESLLIAWKSPG